MSALVALFLMLGASAPAPAGAGCNTRACEKRVKIHQAGYPGCNTYACVRRVDQARARRAAKAWRQHYLRLAGILERIARCESGGNPRAVSPGGHYRGKYQFDYGTWRSVGGTGDPAAASEGEQDYRAARLYQARGPQPWPICGYR